MKLNIWPYIEMSLFLVKKERKGYGNMFRHQIETFSILLEFGYHDPVLLKASLIHDLFEDGQKVGFTDFEKVIATDSDGKEVYDLVLEVTQRVVDGREEPKTVFLSRVMNTGTSRAKLLKLADRLSNINTLLSTNDKDFIKRYYLETWDHIVPYAADIDEKMAEEMQKSLAKLEGFILT